jgi:hypothetical protein
VVHIAQRVQAKYLDFYTHVYDLKKSINMRPAGIESALQEWKSCILPLNYGRGMELLFSKYTYDSIFRPFVLKLGAAKKMRGVGIEPTRISPRDLKTLSLTTRTSSQRGVPF